MKSWIAYVRWASEAFDSPDGTWELKLHRIRQVDEDFCLERSLFRNGFAIKYSGCGDNDQDLEVQKTTAFLA